jgi:hypothetical protein
MRAALCISGQPRNIEIGSLQIKHNIINANTDLDINVFCHCWNPTSEMTWDTSQDNLKNQLGLPNKNAVQIIKDNLNPVKIFWEDQIDFSGYVKYFNSNDTAKQTSVASNFYSMYKVNELKRQYELENNFVYDYVLRLRYDLIFKNNFILSKYKNYVNTKIVVPRDYQEDQDNIPWNIKNKGMVDVFALSNSSNMDKYCQTFLKMPSINREYSPPFAEVYLGVNTRLLNKIDLYYSDIKLNLIRRTN